MIPLSLIFLLITAIEFNFFYKKSFDLHSFYFISFYYKCFLIIIRDNQKISKKTKKKMYIKKIYKYYNLYLQILVMMTEKICLPLGGRNREKLPRKRRKSRKKIKREK